MKRVNSMVWGTVLLLAGLVLTLGQLNILDLSNMLVPIILLALAVIFHLYYFLSRSGNEGLLVPGGILLTYGVMFAVSRDSGIFENGLWPLLIIGPAVGLFELYAFSRGRQGSMVPVFILTAVGGAFLLVNFYNMSFGVIAAIVLIVLGVSLMITAFFKGPRKNEYGQYQTGVQTKPVDPEPPKAEPKPEEPPKQ
jgi:hypothetical protein